MAGKFILTAQLKLVAPGNTKAIVDQINRQLKGVNATVNIKVNTKSLNNLAAQLTSTSKAAKTATSDIAKFGEQAALAIRRYGAFTLATGGFIKLTQAISAGVDEAIKFDRELVRVAQVTGQSLKSLQGLSKEITRLSTEFGVSSTEILKASVTLSQAGLSTKDVQKSLEALAKTGVSATFGDIQNTTEATIAIFQQFGIQAKDLEKTLSSINKVSAQFAIESDDIAVAVRRAGGAFEAAGGNLNEFIALFTSVRQTTRESAESIATGFRTIFTRLQRSRTQDFFKQFGIDLRNLEGQFVGPFEAIKRISTALQNLETTDPRFNQIVEELGGFRQVSKVVPLLTQFDVAQKALNTAVRGGNSLTEDAAAAQDALAIKIQKVKEEFADLIRTITSNSAFRGLIDGTLELASALIKLTKSIEPLLPLLTAFGAAAIAPQIGKFAGGFKSKIFGFSAGGMVPGHGNSDNVPALLTPGEFVLNKRAVSGLSSSTLSAMNKYAGGGLADPKEDAKRIKEEKNKARQALAEQKAASVIRFEDAPFSMIRPESNSGQISVNNTAGIIAKRGSSSASAGAIVLKKLNDLGIQENTKIVGSFGIHGLNKQSSEKFDKGIESGLTGVIEGLTNNLIPPNMRAALNPSDPPPISQLISNSAIRSIKGQFFEAIVKRAASDFRKNDSDDIFDFVDNQRQGTTFSNLGQLFENAGSIRYPADAKAGNIDDAKISVLNKAIRFFNVQRSGNTLSFKKFATGGSVPGSGNGDTVPSLLTPGEFVVNKRSARAIGYGNLKRMNKYATGGKVGAAADLASSPLVAFAGFSALQLLSNSIGGVNSELSNLINVIGQLAARFVALSAVVGTSSGTVNKVFGSNTPFTDRGFARGFENSGLGTRREGLATFRRVQKLSVGVGTVAGLGGEFLSNRANESISQGVDARGQAAFGSALSGAGTGAAIGAIFGPFGAGIGAAIGALGGLTYSLSTTSKELDKARFGQKLEKLGSTLDQFSKGRVSANKINDDVVKILDEAVTKFSTSSIEDQKDITATFKQNEQVIEKYFNEVASGSGDMEEFNKKTKDALINFAVLTKIPFKSLEESIRNSLNARDKELKAIELAFSLRQKEISNIETMITVMEGFEVAANGIKKFNSQIESIFAVIGGTGLSTIGNANGDIFKNAKAGQIGAVGIENLVKSGRGVTQNLPTGGDELLNELKDTALLFNKLPAIISTFNKQAGGKRLNDGTDESLLVEIAKNQFKIRDKATLQNFSEVIKQNFLGAQDDTTKLTGQFTNETEAAEKIRNQMSKIFDVFENAAGTLEQKEALFINAFTKQINIENKRVDLQLEALDRQRQFNEQIRELDLRPIKFGEALGGLGTSLRTAAGFGGIGTNFGAASSAIQSRILGLQNQANAFVIGSNERLALLAEIKQEEKALNRVNKALEILTRDSTVLSAGFRQLDKIGEKNKFLGGLVGTTVFGGRDEQKELLRTFNDLTNLLASKNFDIVPQDRRRDLEQFLLSAGDSNIFGTPANELLEKLVRDLITFSVGKKVAETPEGADRIETLVKAYLGKITPEQQKLINEMQLFITKQKQNNESIINVLEQAPKDIQTALIKANDEFLKRLESIFLANQRGDIEGRIASNDAESQTLSNKLKAANALTAITGTNSLTEARAAANKKISDLTSEKEKIGLSNQAQDLRNALDSSIKLNKTDKDIKASINRAFQKNDILNKEEKEQILRSSVDTNAFKATVQNILANKITGPINRSSGTSIDAEISKLSVILDTIGNDFKSIEGIKLAIDKLKSSTDPLRQSNEKLQKSIDMLNESISGKKTNTNSNLGFVLGGGVVGGSQVIINQQRQKSIKDDKPLNIKPPSNIQTILPSFKEDEDLGKIAERTINESNFQNFFNKAVGGAKLAEKTMRARVANTAATHFPGGFAFGAPVGIIKRKPLVGLPEAPIPEEPKSEKFLAMQEQMRKNREANAQRRKEIVAKINERSSSRKGLFENPDGSLTAVPLDVLRNRRRLAGMTRGAALNNRPGPLTREVREQIAPIQTPVAPSGSNLKFVGKEQAAINWAIKWMDTNLKGRLDAFRKTNFRGGVEPTPVIDKADKVINKMTSGFDKLESAVSKMPSEIQLTGIHRVEVIHNGIDVFRGIEPSLQTMITNSVNKAFKSFIDKNNMQQLRLPDEV